MSSAQSWSVKGIDPKVREAAREAAARQGMTLGEYLNQALQNHQPSTPVAPTPHMAAQRFRTSRLTTHSYDDEEDDWHVPTRAPETLPRITDPMRLAQRIDAIERRTQLAVTGLDRAVSTMDRSVLGLAARVEDAEAISRESADRINDALEQFRSAGDTLSGRLEAAENEVSESREALDSAKIELGSARERLEAQVAAAEDIARKAEAAAAFLTTEMANREAALGHRLGALADQTTDALAATLSEARAAAQDAAHQAGIATDEALAELRQLHARLADRTETALQGARAEQVRLAERFAQTEGEVARLESQINARVASAETLKSDQAALVVRIEKAEANSRESTAGLRQAAGAAIADLRNAQLSLAARLKQVEEASGRTGALDLADVRTQQTDIAQRLAALEARPAASPVDDALARFEQKLADLAARTDSGASQQKLDEVGGAVKTLDESLQRLAERVAATETSANSAIRTLEETVSGLNARVDGAGAAAPQETEALRAMVEQRLDTMMQSVSQTVGEARAEFAHQISAALEGANDESLEGSLLDVNRRLAAAERRQAQTIEAISIEIKRMSETVDRRLRAVEDSKGGDAGIAVREELARMSNTLEARFEEIERREAAAFDRMGLEVGRLSERLEERVGAVENRSAQAIEHVGDQVARMAERFNQRHEMLARDLGERMLDSEERSGARVSEAINSIMQRLGEVEERSAEAVAPVQKAVSSIASRLEGMQTDRHDIDDDDDIPTPARRTEDYASPFDAAEDYTSPTSYTPPSSSYTPAMDAAQPLRAGPLPPLPPLTAQAPAPDDHDIYFAEDVDIPMDNGSSVVAPAAFADSQSFITIGSDDEEEETLSFEDSFSDDAEAVAPPPPEDDDPFWAPEPAFAEAPAPIEDEFNDALDQPTFEPAQESDTAEIAPTPPPGRNDYLNAARKAALAQATPTKTREPTPTYSLRGSSRIVLWGAASAIALLIAGGAWYLNAQDQAAHRAPPAEPQPDVTPPTQALTPPAQVYDPNAPTPDATAAPDAATTTDTTTGAPAAAPAAGDQPAIAQATPPVTAATPTRTAAATAPQQRISAAPLPPRSLSVEQAAQSGDLVAQYELGLQRIAAGRSTDGISLLRRAADHGMPMAQYRLGKIYERGEGVPVDLTQARQWTERAAGGGNRRAMHDLGVYFARGEGAPLDEAAAFRWFRQAAELGVADSQYNLGVLYQQGRGVGASPSEALFWFLVAARQGDADASARATALEGQLTSAQAEQARSRAEAFRPRAASGPANGEFGPRPWSTPAARPGA